jgi:hypothetical protein
MNTQNHTIQNRRQALKTGAALLLTPALAGSLMANTARSLRPLAETRRRRDSVRSGKK